MIKGVGAFNKLFINSHLLPKVTISSVAAHHSLGNNVAIFDNTFLRHLLNSVFFLLMISVVKLDVIVIFVEISIFLFLRTATHFITKVLIFVLV